MPTETSISKNDLTKKEKRVAKLMGLDTANLSGEEASLIRTYIEAASEIGIKSFDSKSDLAQVKAFVKSNSLYDTVISFSEVTDAGNEGIGIRGFLPPETIPASSIEEPTVSPVIAEDDSNSLLFNYQVVGDVPYEYQIGQYEVTTDQYVAFLNAVDPSGENKEQPWTKVKLWSDKNSPLSNPHQGQIAYIQNATDGKHYTLADETWGNKPIMFLGAFQLAYFMNSLTNGEVVAGTQENEVSPEGFNVKTNKKYMRFSEDIYSGAYRLDDSNYAFLSREGNQGFFMPSQDEWVKAAYFAGNGNETSNETEYFYYPTSSNEAPLPLFTSLGKDLGLSQGDSADNVNAIIDVGTDGNVNKHLLNDSVLSSNGYATYDYGVFWQPTYAPQNTSKANVTDVGGSGSPSPWLAYDMGGNLVEITDTISKAPESIDGINPQDVPIYLRAHGGITNAAEYQLWITATGASDPYGQVLGSGYQYGGARVSHVEHTEFDYNNSNVDSLIDSGREDPLTGIKYVSRVDSVDSLDTYYTSDIKNAINKLYSGPDVSREGSGYVSMGNPFWDQATQSDAKSFYSLLHVASSTHFYTSDNEEAKKLSETEHYSNLEYAFEALSSDAGSVDYTRYFNTKTGANGYSNLAVDHAGFIAAGYTDMGTSWSVD